MARWAKSGHAAQAVPRYRAAPSACAEIATIREEVPVHRIALGARNNSPVYVDLDQGIAFNIAKSDCGIARWHAFHLTGVRAKYVPQNDLP
jgi:hypothetical protein